MLRLEALSTDNLPLASQGIKPFILHLLPSEIAHLCPVRAYGEWQKEAMVRDGYVFRKLTSGDRISADNQPMVSKLTLSAPSLATDLKLLIDG